MTWCMYNGAITTVPTSNPCFLTCLEFAEGDQNTADNIPARPTESQRSGMNGGAQDGPWHEEVPARATSISAYASEEPATPVMVHPPAGMIPVTLFLQECIAQQGILKLRHLLSPSCCLLAGGKRA
jgi:hypothetical protein